MTKTYKQLVDETLKALIGKESKRDIVSLETGVEIIGDIYRNSELVEG